MTAERVGDRKVYLYLIEDKSVLIPDTDDYKESQSDSFILKFIEQKLAERLR